MLRTIIVAAALAVSAGVAISAIPANHTHESDGVVSHQGAPLDANGCHLGPTGYHCH
ncbi:MAG: hypothetical protein ACR2OX_07645 [Methyloligellaceae bacterium]